MPYQSAPSLLRRWLAGLLALMIGLGPLASPAYAALTPLADGPINIKNQAKPNIILTVDDSSSMLFDFLPDYIIGTFDPNGTGKAISDKYCRDGTGAMASRCGDQGSQNDFTIQAKGKYKSPGYIFQQFNVPNSSFATGFDNSGPGAGCDTSAASVLNGTYKCSPGIDPGVAPGLRTYPSSSIYGGQPYEYWLLWAAPVHNSAFNHVYYNPRLTYDPAVDKSGISYPQMDAAHTTNWTAVPADPWASSIINVDLTASVTVGQWCNSDWTQGTNPGTGNLFATDAAYCRTNGAVAAASSGAPAADGDYTYPWLPPSSTPDAKYFYPRNATNVSGVAPYPNDNLLWCDATSPSWPQTGQATIPQICNGYQNNAQTCGSSTPQTCQGGTAQTCAAIVTQTCQNSQTQTCNNINRVQTCQNSQTQTCNGITAQTCNGYQTQTCNNINAQTCNGYQTQTCNNITAQTCNNYQTQTCANITTTCTHPDPSTCTTTLSPNPCGGPEDPVCTPVTTCPPDTCVTAGKCTVTGVTCNAANEPTVCTPINGACSATGATCQPANVATQCPGQGKCSVSNATCTAANAAAICTAINGTCSVTAATCQPANQATQCPPEGRCNVTNALCTSTCPAINGACNVTSVACQPANQATQCPAQGNCSVSNALCTTTCPTINGGCSITGAACTVANQAANCPLQGMCSVTGNACTAANAATNCPTLNGTCSATGAACTVANQATKCPDQPGHCSIQTGIACTAANASTKCLNQGMTCSSTGVACTAANAATNCPALGGTCSITGVACTPANAATKCPAQITNGTCSITGATCQGSGQGNCPNVNSPATGAICSALMNASTKSLLEDANDKGIVCRHNNQSYAALSAPNPATSAVTADRFNYPSGRYTVAVTAGVGPNACSPTPSFTSVPRHYWKTEVEWCDNSISSADKWQGYGTGTCQSFKDPLHTFPRFYQFGAAVGSASYTDNYSTAAFARVDLVPSATYTHTWTDDAGATQTIVRTYAEEMTNYANWFAYYRTRIQAVKTVTSLAFLGKTGGTYNLDDSFRVGFHTLSNLPATSFVAVADFDAAQKDAWAKQLFAITIPLGAETPNLNAMMRIGQYYSPGGSSELSGADPIILSCQKNWHMLFTDGFTNQPALPATVVNDQDDTVPAAIPVNGATTVAVTGLNPGAAWPPPFREDPTGTASNSASDYSMNYWVTDLRPAMPMNVATSQRDPASWPHLNFAAMSLGTEGKLPAGNQASVEAQLSTVGGLQWPQPYPNVYKPDISGVDDLWHAAINGRGRFVNAQSADELKLGMGQILQDVVNQAGARAGAGFQSTTLSASNAYIYRTTFEPGWGASLSKVNINPTTGAEISVIWEASTQLAAQLTVVPGVKDTPWFTDRKVITVDETGAAVPFLAGSIGTNQLDSLAPGKTARAQAIVEFLRGNRNNEGTKLGQFRVRIGGLLGDIVDSQPVYVGKPNAPYLEANDPGYTINFKNDAAFAGRPVRVYVGANDGMLHSFDDANGNEAWAFVPSDLFRADETGLGALSYQDGALPPFVHHYYVDATPRISDVNFGGGDADWHTMLVGGLGKGGKAYFALDISQPADITSETEAAKRVLWKFSNDDLGYTYGKAIVAKTHAFGGQWVVIVPSGYNNVPDTTHPTATGKGKIFILSAKDGSLLKTMTTNSGSTTSPSGLAQIAAYEKDYRNQFAEQVYGGDLDGNFWRFDISSSDDTAWTLEKIATFTDKLNGKGQAVTTPPQIEIDIANGVDRWVFVGTGRLLDDTDLTTPAIKDQIQTMYAIRDGTALAPVTPWPATLDGHADLLEVTDANGLAAKPDKGWFDDLPAGQRIVVPVQAALSLVAYIGTSPQTDPCLTGQPATVYAREYGRGNSLLLDEAGTPVESLFEQEGGVSIQLVALDGGSGDSGSGGFPDLRIAITAGTTGKVTYVKPKDPDFAQKHRMSWRLLGQ